MRLRFYDSKYYQPIPLTTPGLSLGSNSNRYLYEHNPYTSRHILPVGEGGGVTNSCRYSPVSIRSAITGLCIGACAGFDENPEAEVDATMGPELVEKWAYAISGCLSDC